MNQNNLCVVLRRAGGSEQLELDDCPRAVPPLAGEQSLGQRRPVIP